MVLPGRSKTTDRTDWRSRTTTDGGRDYRCQECETKNAIKITSDPAYYKCLRGISDLQLKSIENNPRRASHVASDHLFDIKGLSGPTEWWWLLSSKYSLEGLFIYRLLKRDSGDLHEQSINFQDNENPLGLTKPPCGSNMKGLATTKKGFVISFIWGVLFQLEWVRIWLLGLRWGFIALRSLP